jgi:hypothetical protein
VPRFALLLAVLFAASTTLWSSAASAHGGSHERVGADRAQPAAGPATRADALAQAVAPSHCPADDNGLPCACGPDRCTNFPHPPVPLLAQASLHGPQVPLRDVPPFSRNQRAIADRPPIGTVGSRAPPLSS